MCVRACVRACVCYCFISLTPALNTQNVLVKKQVFELLACLCAYSIDGYDVALDTLEAHQVSCRFM